MEAGILGFAVVLIVVAAFVGYTIGSDFGWHEGWDLQRDFAQERIDQWRSRAIEAEAKVSQLESRIEAAIDALDPLEEG